MHPLRIAFLILILAFTAWAQSSFVSIKDHQLYLHGKPYTFVGTNYWYGSLLPLEKDKNRGIDRLRHELDFLKKHGVTNLRLMAGAEGSGPMNGVTRVGPPLEPEQGKFDENVLRSLDTLLAEMGKRKMKAVIFLSNNWEWSGGFQQYLIWNNVIGDDLLTRKPDWDELRDIVAKFYTCEACVAAYRRQVEYVITHTNGVTKKRYIDDPTIMAWELANEPRPMRPRANDAYLKWINDSAAYIKSLDHNHLVTTGSEGWIGTVDKDLFEKSHASKDIDYITIHIWPKNWGWLVGDKPAFVFENAVRKTGEYVYDSVETANSLDKPLVIEEFGAPRDNPSIRFARGESTGFRDRYYREVLSNLAKRRGGYLVVAGINFWAFGGTARPIPGQPFWKPGDDRMGDPPMEEQGLNSVFESDTSTWHIIDKYTHR
ncbi:MAG: cellulase family glycosylhydrolase [Acidobacteria bacterium]|nr:cellulase family glycosylhydrolase [Acidobacteriota bacterium]